MINICKPNFHLNTSVKVNSFIHSLIHSIQICLLQLLVIVLFDDSKIINYWISKVSTCTGLGGATVEKLAASDELLQLMLYRPTRIFVQIGGNDINGKTTAESVFKEIKNFVQEILLKDYGASEVIIGSLFPRYKPRGSTYTEYELKRKKINQLLQEEFQSSSTVFFWKLRGLVDPPSESMPDCVHLCPSLERRYARQIKLALFCKL